MAPSTPSRQPTAPLPPSDGNDQGAQQEYFRLHQGGWDPESVATATLDLDDAAPPGSNPERILATLAPAAGSHLAPQPAPINFGALGTSQDTV